MTDAATDAKAALPPYIAFKTLIDLIERMEQDGPPRRVDPSYLDSYAGGYRSTVIGNLQTLGLLDKGQEPTELLLTLVRATEADRKRLIGDLVQGFYSDVFALGLNSTQQQLMEIFTAKGVKGDTRRKAISFFMKAAKFADVPVGSLWRTPPATTPASGSPRRRTPPAAKITSPSLQPHANQPLSGGETVVVNLGTAGRVTVIVEVKWLELDDEHVKKLRNAIRELKSMVNATKPAESDDSDDDDDDEGTE